MKNQTLLAAILLSTLNPQLSTVLAQGLLIPPGAPAPTMKTLAQIDAKLDTRTPISAVPFTISQPGSYYLTTNLTTTVSNAIVITANGVTLDLSGFTIASTMASSVNGGFAILLAGTATTGLSDISIFNGHIRSGVTNNGSGVFSGFGFTYGIHSSSHSPLNTRVSAVSVAGCSNIGISLGTGDSTVVESCTVRTIGGIGIQASTVKNSVAVDCGGSGIWGDQVSDSRGESVGTGIGIYTSAALNCYGSANNNSGINAVNAQNCRGISIISYGLYAAHAQNCDGSSTSGIGLYTYEVAIGCSGDSTSNTGLSAFIANSCHGVGNPGLSVTHNVNSF